jgi:two-component system NtrC family sensor kinase
MPAGGDLAIATRIADPKAAGILESNGGDEWLEVVFDDTGSGIPDEHLTRVFDPFFTTKKDGTGLGLAITYRIIENHRGVIRVVSEAGKGTTFVITIPLEGSVQE